MKKVTQIIGISILLVLSAYMSQAIAAKDPVYTPTFNNLAIKGYDTVAYFTLGEPKKGSKDFQYEWKGAAWRFISAEHLEMFKAEPEKFAPQYGGYCAWALSENKLAPVNPKQWHIVNDKLYLNYNAKIQKKWLEDRDNLIMKGDNNWPSVLE
jgi:hypothetical protein